MPESSPPPPQTTPIPATLAAEFEARYPEFRAAAAQLAARERRGTFQPTELVHHAFLKLKAQPDVARHGATFFKRCFAAQCKRILVDQAREHAREQRALGQRHDVQTVSLAGAGGDRGTGDSDEFEVLALHEALATLAGLSPRLAEITELRFFGGMTIAECAQALGLSHGTIEKDWRLARAWLRKNLS